MRPTFPTLLLIALIPAIVPADELRSERDIAYSDAGDGFTRLDIYAPAEGKEHPVVVWIHGGGWRRGDKGNVQQKPAAFASNGYVLVSVNYRFHPDVSYKEQGSDVARAILWVREHIRDFGGDPEKLFLMGHSAGAHLAALVATDQRYLEAEKLKLDALRGVVLLDGAGYDIPRQIRIASLPRLKQLYTAVFSDNEEMQKDASPIAHVERARAFHRFSSCTLQPDATRERSRKAWQKGWRRLVWRRKPYLQQRRRTQPSIANRERMATHPRERSFRS